jgi:cysteinyl-tRNA synthetase
LERILPPEVVILGIDEHTACIMDFQAEQILFKGVGTVTIRRGQFQKVYRDGENLSIAEFRKFIIPLSGPSHGIPLSSLSSPPPPEIFLEKIEHLQRNFESLLQENKGAAVVDILVQLDKLIWKSCKEFEDEERIAKARETFRTLIVHLGLRFDECPKDVPAILAPLMNILLEVRGKLRLAKQWAAADEIRNRLLQAGILIEDAPGGSRWHLKQ